MLRRVPLVVVLLTLASLARADADEDGIDDAFDNCPYTSNFGQEDAGGVLTLAPDGIGDACQCGDVDDDGLPNVTDVSRFRRVLLALEPPLGAPQKCDVAAAAGTCDADDVTRMRDALAGVGLGLEQICAATQLPPAAPCDELTYPGADRFAVRVATGHCYVSFDDELSSFGQARDACVALGAHLVTITSAKEAAVVASVRNPAQNPWIGASEDADTFDAVFEWVTGEPWGYTQFFPGEPDNDGSDGDCLHLRDSLGGWGDTSCYYIGYVTGRICEGELAN